MLYSRDIVDLYQKESYNIIQKGLRENADSILIQAIDNCKSNICLITLENISGAIVTHLLKNPSTHEIFQSMIIDNVDLRNKIQNILEYHCVQIFRHIVEHNDILALNIIITYFTSDIIMEKIMHIAINLANLNIIEILFNIGHDIKTIFDKLICTDNPDLLVDEIKFSTAIALEQYGADIRTHINDIAMIIFWTEDLSELGQCLEYGADANYIMARSISCTNIDIIDYLLQFGADINCIDIKDACDIIGYCDNNFDYIVFLIEHGFDTHKYINDIILYSARNNCPKILTYFIKMGADIHFENELALFYACRSGWISCVEILLENGADVHADNNSILLFADYNMEKFSKINCILSHNLFEVAEILIKNGASVPDPTYIFCLYSTHVTKFGANVSINFFTYLLDQNINLNIELNPKLKNRYTKYIFESIIYWGSVELVNLCLQYGADPFINNNGPLKIAIQRNKLDLVRILLKLGVWTDLELDDDVGIEMSNLLSEYHITIKFISYI